MEILNYSKVQYNWFLTKIIIDDALSEKNTINYAFPNCKIIPCFFHLVLNITKHMKAIKSKNITLKKINIISNNINNDIIS